MLNIQVSKLISRVNHLALVEVGLQREYKIFQAILSSLLNFIKHSSNSKRDIILVASRVEDDRDTLVFELLSGDPKTLPEVGLFVFHGIVTNEDIDGLW